MASRSAVRGLNGGISLFTIEDSHLFWCYQRFNHMSGWVRHRENGLQISEISAVQGSNGGISVFAVGSDDHHLYWCYEHDNHMSGWVRHREDAQPISRIAAAPGSNDGLSLFAMGRDNHLYWCYNHDNHMSGWVRHSPPEESLGVSPVLPQFLPQAISDFAEHQHLGLPWANQFWNRLKIAAEAVNSRGNNLSELEKSEILTKIATPAQLGLVGVPGTGSVMPSVT